MGRGDERARWRTHGSAGVRVAVRKHGKYQDNYEQVQPRAKADRVA